MWPFVAWHRAQEVPRAVGIGDIFRLHSGFILGHVPGSGARAASAHTSSDCNQEKEFLYLEMMMI